MHIVIFITVGNRDEGLMIAKALVEGRLAACANILENVSSIYWWEGRVEQSKECLLTVKTVDGLLQQIIDKVKELHSYRTPEIIAFEVKGGSKDYLDWVEASVVCGKG